MASPLLALLPLLAPAQDDAAPLRGVLLDDATGQPLAGLVLELRRGSTRTRCVTDGAGAFTTAQDLRRGAVRASLALADGERVSLVARTLAHDPDRGVPHELRARIGPAYRVSLAGAPEPAAGWRARWVIEGPARSIDGPWRPLDDGHVRFPAPLPDRAPGQGVLLEVEDGSGAWVGRVQLESVTGDHQAPLEVELARLASIRGVLVYPGGQPVSGAQVFVAPDGGAPLPVWESEPWTRHRAQDDGRFEVRRLAPGAYHLRIAPPDDLLLDRRVLAPAGGVDLGSVEVGEWVGRYDLSGTLESAAGRVGLSVMLDLRSADGRVQRTWLSGSPLNSALWFQQPNWSSDPSQHPSSQAFAFEDLPGGAYTLRVIPWDGWRWEDLELWLPSDPVVLRRPDQHDERVAVGLRVVDAVTGEELPEYAARFTTRRWQKPRWSDPDHALWASGAVLGSFDLAADLEWSVWTQDHVPAHGDLSAFADLEGETRILTLRLERGWGARLRVRDGSDPRREFRAARAATSLQTMGSRPLEGVVVRCDGELVGRTGPDGILHVRLPAEPRELTYEKQGWVAAPGPCWTDGKLKAGVRTPDLWMVPGS